MHKALSLLTMMFLPVLALAQDETAHAPSETVSMVYVVIFLALFFGSIIGFFVYLLIAERRKKQQQS